MYNLVGTKEDDPSSLLPHKNAFYKGFKLKLRLLIKVIGLNPENYSTQGFRRGGSFFAFKSGVPADLIQLHGDWPSGAYKKVWKTK